MEPPDSALVREYWKLTGIYLGAIVAVTSD